MFEKFLKSKWCNRLIATIWSSITITWLILLIGCSATSMNYSNTNLPPSDKVVVKDRYGAPTGYFRSGKIHDRYGKYIGRIK